jgi:hypothetical protein
MPPPPPPPPPVSRLAAGPADWPWHGKCGASGEVDAGRLLSAELSAAVDNGELGELGAQEVHELGGGQQLLARAGAAEGAAQTSGTAEPSPMPSQLAAVESRDEIVVCSPADVAYLLCLSLGVMYLPSGSGSVDWFDAPASHEFPCLESSCGWRRMP